MRTTSGPGRSAFPQSFPRLIGGFWPIPSAPATAPIDTARGSASFSERSGQAGPSNFLIRLTARFSVFFYEAKGVGSLSGPVLTAYPTRGGQRPNQYGWIAGRENPKASPLS
jgi:hypothetical protein